MWMLILLFAPTHTKRNRCSTINSLKCVHIICSISISIFVVVVFNNEIYCTTYIRCDVTWVALFGIVLVLRQFAISIPFYKKYIHTVHVRISDQIYFKNGWIYLFYNHTMLHCDWRHLWSHWSIDVAFILLLYLISFWLRMNEKKNIIVSFYQTLLF